METKRITIAVRSWFDKTYGNSYYSLRAWIDNADGSEPTVIVPFAYGRGRDTCVRCVIQLLADRGFTNLSSDISEYDLTKYHGVDIRVDMCDVTRRKDMHNAGRGDLIVNHI